MRQRSESSLELEPVDQHRIKLAALYKRFIMTHFPTASGRWLLLIALLRRVAAANFLELNLGSLELSMQSRSPVEEQQTNPLLREILEVTVDFLDESFYEQLDSSFQKVSCSIVTYQTQTTAANSSSYYTAKLLLTGRATFLSDTTMTQAMMHKYTVATFENQDQIGSFLTNLKEQASDLPFLAQLETATVTVNGQNPLDDDTSSYPPPSSSSSQNTEDRDLAMWQIAVIAGAGAFVLVLVAALTFICCMKVDPDDPNYRRCGGDTVTKKTLAVQTLSTTRVDSSIMDKPSFDVNDCALSCKSPSPVRSITSQDSSIFTYNPRSVRSAQTGYSQGGTYFTSNTNIEMDLAAWQGSAHLAQVGGSTSQHVPAQQPANLSSCFGDGNDISAIESALSIRAGMHDDHRDLSLIQEEDPLYSSSIAASSPSTTPDHRSSNAVTESALNELVNMERGRMNMMPSVAAAYMSSNRNSLSPDDNTELVESHNGRSGRGRRLTAEGQFVRNDLEELSYQIDAYRTQPY